MERGYQVYAATTEARSAMEGVGIPVTGGFEELLERVDVVVDCTPKKVGARNRPRYRAAGVKSIWQGGEKHEVAGYSFVAQVNYAGALGRDSARTDRPDARRLSARGTRFYSGDLCAGTRALVPYRLSPLHKEMPMTARSGVAMVSLTLVLASCGGNGEEVETAEVSAVDTASMGMPAAGMPGGMGPMAGMGPGTMMADWEQHMAAMHGASGDSLRAVMGRHRQMTMRMMERMDSTHGRMGMPMNSAWVSLRDSLRQDLQRMQGMSPEQMEGFLEAHDARMRRMLEMHRSTTGQAPQ